MRFTLIFGLLIYFSNCYAQKDDNEHRFGQFKYYQNDTIQTILKDIVRADSIISSCYLIYKYYDKNDSLVSVLKYYQAPSKVQAYMAAGKPIIACLNGEGARLVKEAGAGLTAPAEDARALADKVLELYRAPAGVRNEMGINGRNYCQQHFNHGELVDKLIKHLAGVAKVEADRQ